MPQETVPYTSGMSNGDDVPPAEPVMADISPQDSIDIDEDQTVEYSHRCRPYVQKPCPCTTQFAMYFIAGTEVFAQIVVIGIFSSFYKKFGDPNNLNHFESILVLAEEWAREELMTTNETAAYMAKLCLVHILVALCQIIASVLLVVGALRRNSLMCITWIVLASCFVLTRLVADFLMPIYLFSWGTLWIVMELYFIYAVSCFIREIWIYPEGYVYKSRPSNEFSDFELPVTQNETKGHFQFQLINRRIVYYDYII